jgi:hypothetical protein
MPSSGLPLLGLAVHAAPAADDPFDMLGRASAADRQQPLLCLGRGDTRKLADLGVGQLSTRKGLRQSRQSGEGARYSHVLPRRARREPDAPREPRRARAEAITPTSACVEFANEIQEPGSRAVQMRRQLSDLVTQAIQLCGDRNVGRVEFHLSPPNSMRRLYTQDFGLPGRRHD